MNKLYVISTSRSDYGCLKYIIDELENQHVSHKHLNYQWIQSMGIETGISELVEKFNNEIHKHNIKNIFILGDRWETLILATIATYHNINIYHQGGGELSNGAYDNEYRNAISQLSNYHFVIDDSCRKRLLQQNVHNENIFICGSPRLDNDKSLLKDFRFKKQTGLVIYHPTTKNNNAYNEINELLDSLRYFDMNYIILYPNADKESNVIIDELTEFAYNEGVKLYKRLKLVDYYNVLNSVDIMIGNSSAGIIETASYNLPAVNIGDRQHGRDCNDNVIHCKCKRDDIVESIATALTLNFNEKCEFIVNKFGDGKASKKIVDIIKGILV